MNKALCAALAFSVTLATVAAQGQTYSVLHGFAGINTQTETSGSATPNAPLTYMNGNLYGTTTYGGTYDLDQSGRGWGTVYSINAASGAGDLIYSFVHGLNKCVDGQQIDGVEPSTSLVPYTLNGETVLYGTTTLGGATDNGTIFKIDSTGGECVVWSFGNANGQSFPDGSNPYAGLVWDAATKLFYGTTLYGGNSTLSCGTIFSFDPNALPNVAEQVVYSFQNNGDGCGPQASLILVNGILYGTTSGWSLNPPAQPLGSVFGFNPVTQSMMVNSSGNTMISDFQGGLHDGAQPMAPLVYDQAHNMLYGTTEFGGNGWVANGGQNGYGTIFEVNLSANTFQETPIYLFQDYVLVNGKPTVQDGRNPLTGLVYDSNNGQYYVTTSKGPDNVANATGVLIGGTLSPGASGFAAHTFMGGSDGEMPTGGLTFVGGSGPGTIFGTTKQGGGSTNCGNSGCGTVFEYVP